MNTETNLLDTQFERQPEMITRRVAGEVILVPITRRVGEESCLYTLDEVAAFLWEGLDGQQTGRDLIEKLKAAYPGSVAQAEDDVRMFLEQLKAIQAVRPVEQHYAGREHRG